MQVHESNSLLEQLSLFEQQQIFMIWKMKGMKSSYHKQLQKKWNNISCAFQHFSVS